MEKYLYLDLFDFKIKPKCYCKNPTPAPFSIFLNEDFMRNTKYDKTTGIFEFDFYYYSSEEDHRLHCFDDAWEDWDLRAEAREEVYRIKLYQNNVLEVQPDKYAFEPKYFKFMYIHEFQEEFYYMKNIENVFYDEPYNEMRDLYVEFLNRNDEPIIY